MSRVVAPTISDEEALEDGSRPSAVENLRLGAPHHVLGFNRHKNVREKLSDSYSSTGMGKSSLDVPHK
jgi:hypothetical protein